ncbi:branched-chain amino acid ABC transporter substrate-binding protein [uncultured Nitratireductor sp.]|uniref:branched-chain amino acid ABC transporter substrate-binding protein n=1 Tax=uncultured Nitratireductor sp. TaxID=520953 RepID=UPI002600FBC9|nr:branched-chain amino acid ABC transporter substrate-binding protein [uncultured Nitratireductor sp.]
MRCFAILILCSLAAFSQHAAHAQEPIIGLAAPMSDSVAVLGAQMRDGARVAAHAGSARLVEADTQCSAEGGEAAARNLIGQNVSVVVGFLCTDAIEAALPLFAEANIPVITPGVRTVTLTDQRERTGWPVFRTAPRADAERDAVADILVPRWREEFFAIVDDGTIYGRELAENLRAAAELQELKPVFIDTFRPQLDNQIGLAARLRRAGASHVFVGGDRSDIAILARDARGMDYDLVIVGGEALRAETSSTPLAEGTLMIGLPRWADIASDAAKQALDNAEIIPDGYVVPGFAAVQLAIAASRTEAGSIFEALSSGRYETALGSFSFDTKGDLTQGFYRLFRFDGQTFQVVE